MRIIFTKILVFSVVCLVPLIVLGLEVTSTSGDIDILQVIGNIIKWLRTFLVIAGVIAIIIAGFYFVTAEGDPEKLRKAKNFVIYALIGVAVGLLAEAMVSLIRYIIEGRPGGGSGGSGGGGGGLIEI